MKIICPARFAIITRKLKSHVWPYLILIVRIQALANGSYGTEVAAMDWTAIDLGLLSISFF